jgi:hypothetical protein
MVSEIQPVAAIVVELVPREGEEEEESMRAVTEEYRVAEEAVRPP